MAKQKSNVATRQEGAEQAEMARDVPVFRPAADIRQTQNGIMVELDMPSVHSDSIDVTFDRHTLTVTARGRATSPSGYALAYAEYRDGDYERAFRVSERIDSEGIEASYRDGVLCLMLPYTKQAQPKKIEVRAD